MKYTVKELNTSSPASLWDQFYELPQRVYANDPFYLPASVKKVESEITDRPMGEKQVVLVVVGPDGPEARLVVRTAHNLARNRADRSGTFGYFESTDNPKAVAILMRHAQHWLSRHGITHAIGPMNGDTWHTYRFSLGPYNRSPFLMEPYNPSYYPQLWQNVGFKPLAYYYSKHIPDLEPVLTKLRKFKTRALRQGVVFRPLDLSAFEEQLRILYELSCRIFADNYFYREIDFEAFRKLYRDVRTILKKELVWFAFDKTDRPAGFIFSLPDYYDAVKSMQGHRHLWAKFKFLLNRGQVDTVNIKTVGTLPDYRGTGLGPALMYQAYSQACELGLRKANLCLIHEDNASGRLDGGCGTVIRKYCLYEKEWGVSAGRGGNGNF